MPAASSEGHPCERAPVPRFEDMGRQDSTASPSGRDSGEEGDGVLAGAAGIVVGVNRFCFPLPQLVLTATHPTARLDKERVACVNKVWKGRNAKKPARRSLRREGAA